MRRLLVVMMILVTVLSVSGKVTQKCISNASCKDESEICKLAKKNVKRCACKSGYSLVQNHCQDINECEDKPKKCDQLCHNYPGSYSCFCKAGFKMNDSATGKHCTDINECNVNNGGCDQLCENTPGSSKCSCRKGFMDTGNSTKGEQCEDINECNGNNGGCDQLCNNAQGSFKCSCHKGFMDTGNSTKGEQCKDINECETKTSGCDQICNNTHGSFFCSCRPGYAYNSSTMNKGCKDIDECNSSHDCSQICENTDGSYICSCHPGFKAQGIHCNDIDECKTDTNGCDQFCNNTNGSFFCSCKPGYIYNDSTTDKGCKDIDECKPIHDCNQTCSNTIGSYTCLCRPGFKKKGKECDDITVTKRRKMLICSPEEMNNIVKPLPTRPISCQRHPSIQAGLCDNTFSDKEFHTPNINAMNYYGNNEFCKWDLKAKTNKFVFLKFGTFDLEYPDENSHCTFDNVTVYDVYPDKTRIKRGTWCGSSLPPEMRSSTSEMQVEFHSDNVTTGLGFRATWKEVDQASCGGYQRNSNHGSIQIPNDGDLYKNAQYCNWTIKVEEGYSIQFDFESFRLEDPDEERKCSYDKLELFEISNNGHKSRKGIWCGFKNPFTYTSKMSIVMVEFHSDESYREKGFKIRWRKVVTKGCHFTKTANQGTISLELPDGSNEIVHCKWDVTVDEGLNINMKLQVVQLNDKNYTCGNYIEIFDAMENGTLIERFKWCGQGSPPNIKSFGKKMVVKLHSDSAILKNVSSLATWSPDTTCGGVVTTDEGHGHIMSYNYPQNSNKQCAWNIYVREEYHIRFDFPKDQTTNSLRITENGNVLDTLNGSRTVLSSKNEVQVAFNSTDSFFASWKSLCGNTHLKGKGKITYPGHSNDYANDLDCVWEIIADSNHLINLTFSKSFDIEAGEKGCEYDYLEVIEYTPNGNYSRGKFCGQKSPQGLISYFSRMIVVFHTDGDKTGKGFEISWNSNHVCGGDYSSNKGKLTFPDVPADYQIPVNCIWTIQLSPSLHRVTFVVQELNIGNDILQITWRNVNGSHHNSTILEVGTINEQSIDTDIPLEVHFFSNTSTSGKGFKLTWAAVCELELNTINGSFETPNFLDSYPNNEDCTWTIRAKKQKNHWIHIKFDEFDLEMDPGNCVYDYVEVFDHSVSRGKWCGRTKPSPIMSFNPELVIKFHSDKVRNGKGFNASWEIVDICEWTFKDQDNGFIMSPNYGENYPNNVFCKWNIIPPDGVNITLRFTGIFDIETADDCVFDYVEVTGTNQNTTQNKFCGKVSPHPLTFKDEHITIVFKSDESNEVQTKGFSLLWNSV